MDFFRSLYRACVSLCLFVLDTERWRSERSESLVTEHLCLSPFPLSSHMTRYFRSRRLLFSLAFFFLSLSQQNEDINQSIKTFFLSLLPFFLDFLCLSLFSSGCSSLSRSSEHLPSFFLSASFLSLSLFLSFSDFSCCCGEKESEKEEESASSSDLNERVVLHKERDGGVHQDVSSQADACLYTDRTWIRTRFSASPSVLSTTTNDDKNQVKNTERVIER